MASRGKNWGLTIFQVLGGTAVLVLGILPEPLLANPLGEQVVAGAADFARPDPSTLLIHQQTDRAVINWNSFSIANGELTRFIQPSSTSAALNRVVTANPSQIYGTLQANGQIFLINPGGIMVGPGGVVDVAGFVASTQPMDTDEFMKAGSLHLHGNSEAGILNQGNVTAREGDVFLVAREVKNEGQLMAQDGTVGMVSGTEVSLQAVGMGNFKVRLLAAEGGEQGSGVTGQGSGVGGQGSGGQEAEIVNSGVIAAANAVLEAKGSYLPMAIKNTGVIQATGVVHNSDGSVTLTGGEGDVLNTGVVAALQRSLDGQKETGGSILMAGKNVTSDPGSILTAAGRDGGGDIQLRAADTTILRGAIEVVGLSESSKGGQVRLLGEKVGLFDSAKVDASGGAGGGEVLVGGDYLGKNPDVPNAKAVVMAPTAEIRADAKANGDGGRVILWSDVYTAFFGEITALGGSAGGDGGFIETSSAGNLQALGRVQAAAPLGRPGQWLLDPGSIVITTNTATTTNGFSGNNPLVFTAPETNSTVNPTDIEDALNQGTSVTIQTGTGANYKITVSNSITKTLDNATTLSLLATGGITITNNAIISSSNNELFMVFNADLNNNGGVFTLGAGSSLRSNGGAIQITASDVVLSGTNTISTLRTLSGGGTVAGDVFLLPSLNGSTGRPIQVGGAKSLVGEFVVTQAEMTALDITGSALSGTVTVGNRSAGNITLTNSGTAINAFTNNVTLVTGGTILDSANLNTLTTSGLLTLSAAGNIGGSGTNNVLNLAVSRLALVTEGDLYNISTTATLTQFNVTTDGTVASQTIRDNSAGAPNLNFSATESTTTGNTTITALSVGTGSVDFYYENTGLGVQGGGDILIQTPLGGAPTTQGIRNVQSSTSGYSSLNNVYRDLEIRAPRGTITVNSPIFSGGGNITLAAQDFVGIAPDPSLPTNALTGLADFNSYFTNAAVINTFRSTSSGANTNATFGSRVPSQGSANGRSGQISGQGGMLTLEPISQSAAGRDVVLSRVDAYPNTFNLSWDETTMLEAPAIRIGGPQAADIRIQALNEFAGGGLRTIAITTITPGTGGGTQSTTAFPNYVPRYFEQPFFDASRFNGTPVQPSDIFGAPHVAGGFVSFVSALGEVRNLPGGDVNVGTLNLTGVDGVFFDGRGGGNYAETDGATATGSLVGNLAGRVGRTVEDINVGSGGDYVVYLPVSGITVTDGRDVQGVSSLLLPQGAAAGSTISGGSVSGVFLDNVVSLITVTNGGIYSGVPDVSLSVTNGTGSGAAATASMGLRTTNYTTNNGLTGGTNYTTATVNLVGGGGSGAQASALFSTNGVITNIVITSPGSGYTSLPEVLIDGDGQNASFSWGTNAAFTVVSVTLNSPGTSYSTNPTVSFSTNFLAGTNSALAFSSLRSGGGGSYTEAPPIIFYGGGIQLGSARALLDEAALASGGSSGVVSVVPQILGLGYTNAPTVTISDPLGIGTGAEATAFINSRGQLTPFDVSALGDGYTAPPTVILGTPDVSGGRQAVARAEVSGYVKQSSITLVGGTGYTSTPTVTISGGNGFGATATATFTPGGAVTGITITDPGYGYTSAPTITISGGGGTGASATVRIGQGVTGLFIVDPGSGYTSAPTVTLSGGGGSGAVASFNSAGFFTGAGTGGFGLSPIRITNGGTGYTVAPEVSLSGGGIAAAQARAILDAVPTSATYGQIRGYEITDPGAGYKSAPLVSIGSGTPFGNFGEYGVSTEQVDRNRASGNIILDSFDTASPVVSGMIIDAPVRTGNAFGVNGTSAITGSILLDSGTGILTNSDRGADGVIITGDAVVTGGSGSSATTSAQSGSITLGAYSIANTDQSALQRLSGSMGIPVQIGTASGGNGSNLVGALQATLFDRTTAVGVGDLQIYAFAPGQIEAAQGGRPLDPNHPASPPRASNDLALSGLATLIEATDAFGAVRPSSSLVTVEVGGQEGKLTLQRYANSSATATVNEGQVTLITPNQGGALYTVAPTVQITGGGVVQAEGSASISGGQVTGVTIANAGSGYGNVPTVTITGGGGTGATATATVANGVVTGITMVNKGFGYTSLPTVTLGPPTGTPATATAVTGDVQLSSDFVIGILGIQSINITNGGTGYLFPPTVTITDSFGFGQGASAVANISNGTVTSITVTERGLGYVQPVITIGPPAGIAQATANLTNGEITSFTLTDPGGGYGSVPLVRLLSGGADPYNLDTDRVGLFADRFQFFESGTPASVQIRASVVAAGPYTNQRPVNLGTATPGSTSFLNSDIARFTVDSLVLGRRQADLPSVGAGVITISSAVSSTTTAISSGVVLAGTREIEDSGGTTGLSFENVVLDAGGAVSLTGSGNSSQYFSGIIRDSGLAAGAPFSIFSALRTVGTTVLPFTISEVFVDAAMFSAQRFYQGITTQGGDISIFANQIQQTPLVGFLDTTGGGAIPVSTSTVTLAPLTVGTPINLYATSQAAGSLGLRIGNPQAPGLELVRAKELVIGSGSIRDIQLEDGGFGYLSPPTVQLTGGGGTNAKAVAVLRPTGYLWTNGVTYYSVAGIRITDPGSGYTSAPSITISGPDISGQSAARGTAVLGASGAITLSSNLEFNYRQYPQAPFQVSLVSGSIGSITAQKINPNGLGEVSNYYRIRVGTLSITDSGTVSLLGLNDVDELAATITGSGSLSFNDIDAIRLGAMDVANDLTINAGGAITQTTEGISVGGKASFSAGSNAITLNLSTNNQFVGAVTFSNVGSNNHVTITNNRNLDLGASRTEGNLTINTGTNAVTQSGRVIVGGTSTITGGFMTLTNPANSFNGPVNLVGTSTNAVNFSSSGSLVILELSNGGSVAISAGTNLTFGSTNNYNGLTNGITATAGGTLTLSNSMTNLTASSSFLAGSNFVIADNNRIAVSGTNTITLQGSSLNLGGNTSNAVTANGGITLLPAGSASTNTISINNAGGSFTISTNTLRQLSSTGTVTVGSTNQANSFNIGSLGAIDLSGEGYSLNLASSSGNVTFANTLTLPTNSTFNLSMGSGSVSNAVGFAGTSVAIAGTNGTIAFGSANNVTNLVGSAANLGTSAISGNFDYTSVFAGDLNIAQISVGGTSRIAVPVNRSILATNSANAFTGPVTLAASTGTMSNVVINNSRDLTLAGFTNSGSFTSTVTGGALTLGPTQVGGGNFTADAVGIRGGPLVVTNGSATLNGRSGDIVFTNSGNSFATNGVTVAASGNTSLFIKSNQLSNLGTVQATQNFALVTDASNLTLPTTSKGDNQLSLGQIQDFTVGSLSLTADAITVDENPFNFPNVQSLTLNSRTGGITISNAITTGTLALNSGAGIQAAAPITVGTLSLSSAGSTTLNGQNRIQNLGSVRSTGPGSLSLTSLQGMNLVGSVAVQGNASLTVAGQFYDLSGSQDPFAGTTGTATITSLSIFGGLPNLISAVPGFRPGYFFQSPGGNRQMIYAVGPQTMVAPPGTVIAGVNLGGTPTGGGQFDTFLTGSDNLNWMIADFGKFNLPKVDPARLEYMLYRQRVEPETRSLPQPVMRELTQELGRPPTIGEIQQREIAKREAARMRAGALLERSSFDEDVEEPSQEAKRPVPVIDGGKPQAEAGQQRPDDRGRLSGVGGQVSGVDGQGPGGEKPQAKKQTDTKRDPNGPMLRNGPRRAVVLREEALDPIQVVRQERERAEVGVAPPVATK